MACRTGAVERALERFPGGLLSPASGALAAEVERHLEADVYRAVNRVRGKEGIEMNGNAKKLLKAILMSTALIGTINGSLLALMGYAFNVNISVRMEGETAARAVGWTQIVPESIVMPLIGMLIFMGFQRLFKRHAFRLFVIFSVVVTLIWTSGPVQHGENLASKAVLTVTHLVILTVILIQAKRYAVDIQAVRDKMPDKSV